MVYVEQREPCAEVEPLRAVLWGDLHVHTSFSFDAVSYGNRLSPDAAHRFARGEPVLLPPLDDNGVGTRSVQLDRPLDFVAVTDHGEFLGEVAICMTEGMAGYDSETCQDFRSESSNGAFDFGMLLASTAPSRFVDVCGEDGQRCVEAARPRWQAMQEAAEAHYDRTAQCSFTSFPAYEYTNTEQVSNLHRNVVFGHEVVPPLPRTHMDSPTPLALWQGLSEDCAAAGPGCDVIVLPHNSNLSNGRLFVPDYPGAFSDEDQRRIAELRVQMEPVAEIFQHKGDSECSPRFSEDPACAFEKLRGTGEPDCGEDTGTGGMRLWGCSHRLDFMRSVLGEGLREEQRLGVNPYVLGLIGSTDTHNGTPGLVDSYQFPGHVGLVDDTDSKRLAEGTVTHDAIINNPGGLAAVWATENSREAIFSALRRREVHATSGPRIQLRLFGGRGLPDDLCAQDSPVAAVDSLAVAMGGSLVPSAQAPSLFAQAHWDPGTSDKPGTLLQQLQVVKVWLDGEGQVQEQVVMVEGQVAGDAGVDPVSCATTGTGAESLCAVWHDPGYDSSLPALYYARVLENPSCRWSTRQCLHFPESERPPRCDDGSVPDTVQQRAWSSPIWVPAN